MTAEKNVPPDTDDFRFAEAVTGYFRDLAYLHNYYPSSIDQTGREIVRKKKPGHGDFDDQIRTWVNAVADLIMSRYFSTGHISDPESVDALDKEVGAMKRRMLDNELETDLIRENCILDDSMRPDCIHCPYAPSCIGNYTEHKSVYEYFMKTFDFRKTYLNSIYVARGADYLEVTPGT